MPICQEFAILKKIWGTEFFNKVFSEARNYWVTPTPIQLMTIAIGVVVNPELKQAVEDGPQG